MRSMYGPDTLLLASKKPRIKELIEHSKTLTTEEIMALPEKPDVIKGLLLINKFGSEKGTIAQKIAALMEKNSVPSTFEIFDIFLYTGENRWIKHGQTLLEMKEGWYWAKMQEDKILVSSNQLKISINEMLSIEQFSKFIKSGTVYDLGDLEKSRLAKLL